MIRFISLQYKLWRFTWVTGLTRDTVLDFVDSPEITATTKTKTSSIYSNEIMETIVKLRSVVEVESSCYFYSPDIAKTMCCFMSLAYEPAEFIENILSTKGDGGDRGVLLFHDNVLTMIHFDDILIVSFCGTRRQSLRDWWVNITQSYDKEWQKARPIVLAAIEKASSVYVCGHSKGGAEALLAYTDLYSLYISFKSTSKLKGCYVAGTPDYFLSGVVSSVPGVYNIKNNRDPVCFVLSQENLNWEIYLGAKGSVSIENHKLISYYDNL